jgi:acetoin utilization deacetylase AcuC-like enzyme
MSLETPSGLWGEAGAAAPRRTGVVIDPRCAGHCMGHEALECPERLGVLHDMLREPDLQGLFFDIPAQAAEKEMLERVHASEYIRRLEDSARQRSVYLDEDTSTSPLSHEAALLAAGGLCQAIAQVDAGLVDNAFAMVRPPGHHAERQAAKGFCLYNNVAIGARFAQKRLNLARILIVDWDLHHGNGTQHCFEDDPSVLFFSTHLSFAYPYSGSLRDVGKGQGKGYTVNVPLLPGFGDAEYLTLFDRLLKPIALAFIPDLVLVSAGFDIHRDDPLGGMRVTAEGFAGMTRILMEIADCCCRGKLVMTLEGGYGLDGLQDSVRQVLKEMTGLRTTDTHGIMASADRRKVEYAIWRVKRIQRKYWDVLNTSSPADNAAPSLTERLRGCLEWWRAYFRS